MTVWLKQGVLGFLIPPMRRAKGKIIKLYAGFGLDFYITSIGEGNHMAASCHYEGAAIDFKRQKVRKQTLQTLLGKDFDIVEYEVTDVFHVEYDPKS